MTTLSGLMAIVATRRGYGVSEALLRSAVGESQEPARVVDRLGELGILAQIVAADDLDDDFLPALAIDAAGQGRLIERRNGISLIGGAGDVVDPQDQTIVAFGRADLLDSRAGDVIAADPSGWFWPVLWRFRRFYYEAAALSAVINLLSLAGIIFMMTVYDRILPNLAYVTLWSLLVGVAIAMTFEFVTRTIRSQALDIAGKKIDLILGDSIFSHVLQTRLEARARSSGAYANLLKEFESVRGFVTSATLAAVADLPFALLFLVVTLLVGGPLVVVPLIAFLTVLALSLLVQRPMARIAGENLKEASVRHGTIIESLEGIETLKALRAEARMRRRHEVSSAAIAERAIVSQSWSNLSLNLTIAIQQGAGAILLTWGVYLAATGRVTSGALVACVQLNSRALAPLVTLSSLAVRYQQVRSALVGLNRIMAMPVDRDPARRLISQAEWKGEVELKDVVFRYDEDGAAALDGVSLKLRQGEKVAVLGRVGSGKSTLLRLMGGLYLPRAGQITLDGIDMGSIEPSDVRARLLLAGQDARLFHGTLRENLLIAARDPSDAAMIAVAERTGVAAIAAAHPLGYDRPIGERGDTLSGGQRQAVALARALLAQAGTYLLDEPTSAMDQASETALLEYLRELGAQGSGFVVVTHKQSLLPLVDRVVVMDGGKIVADGPREAVVRALAGGHIRTAA
jgi:ATP-binding cassette subfamily C protein LapB